MRFLADENFNNDILRGVRQRTSEADIVRVQDTEIYGADDPTVLAWAAQENRLLLTHDVKTMVKYAYQRIEAGLFMPGIFEISNELPTGIAIEEILTIIGASDANEWEGQVRYLPLR